MIAEAQNNRTIFTLEETRAKDSLIELIRLWYRTSIRDPNLLDTDAFVIPDEWERKINLLKRRAQGLYQKISNPQSEETRLDDYVMELNQWLRERFKEPRQKWQEPKVLVKAIEYDDEGNSYIKFQLNFFVDNMKLEDGQRGDRVNSQIYQEVVQYLKNSKINSNSNNSIAAEMIEV
ncbi:hypothetical protein [Nostoc punctiforme]|uniref:Uncharacterized protein n=1 Tax=Nostoc punctiforme (strain ATCC 29133 / PCC 73102) TaxID=63737 RepID=B2ITG5_NOSP7|nr:hypothetical protein [Nostoc punctiforme]ACC81196.1 hypothetical protein Npun_R2642 [Nostoc punctiforme PCC 73102]